MARSATKAELHPEIVLYNGKIITCDKDFTIAQAVAILGEKFLTAGNNDQILALAGLSTKKIDLAGKTVIPGLIDSHIHQLATAVASSYYVDLFEVKTIADILGAIGEKVKVTQPDDWIVCSKGWHESQLKEGRMPTATELDTVSPNNPVFLPRGGHVCVCNSIALALAKITRDTPDPPGGTIVRDSKTREPTGLLWETARKKLIHPLLPEETISDKTAALKSFMKKLNSYGVTGVTEPGLTKNDIQVYMETWRNGAITVRTNILYKIEKLEDVEYATQTYSTKSSDNFVKIGGLKYSLDGGVEGAALSEKYLIVPREQEDPDYHGHLFLPKGEIDELKRVLLLAARKGWQVQTHSVGDRAIEIAIDLYSKVNDEIPIKDLRWVLMHIFLPTQNMIDKMKKVGIIATIQDQPTYLGYNMVRYWGKDRAASAIPTRKLLDSGIICGGGTDAAVVPWNPFLSIWWMVTRRTVTTGVLGPDQAITREEALQCYTWGSAYTQFQDDIKGSIEPGKLADLVVLTDDILNCPEEKIKDITAVMTIVGGQIVFQK